MIRPSRTVVNPTRAPADAAESGAGRARAGPIAPAGVSSLRRPLAQPRPLVPRFACLVAILFVAACTPPDTPADPALASDTTDVEPVVPQRPLTAADLAAACDGRPVERAAVYAEADTLHQVAVLIRDSTEAAYRFQSHATGLPAEWVIDTSAELDRAQLLLCVTRFPGAFRQTCEFFPSDSTGQPDESAEPSLVDLHDAAYSVDVRYAATGARWDELGVDAPARFCPMLHRFAAGSRREKDYAGLVFSDLRDPLVPVVEPGYDPLRIFPPEERARLRR